MDYALYLFAYRFGDHLAGDHLQFHQNVDLTNVDAIWFDVCMRLNEYGCKSFVSVDGRELWSHNVVGVHLNQAIDVHDFVGRHVLAVGLRIPVPFGQEADGHTYFDNLRVVGPGDMDGDLDIDADDADLHALCMFGPDLPSPGGCELANLDDDDDADVHDLAVLQRNFTGPRNADE